MGDPARLRDRYAIAGVGLSRFGKLPGTSTMGFTLEAAKRAIEDCGVARDAIDGVLALMPAVMGEQPGWASRVAGFLGLTPSFCSTMDMGGATAIGMIQTAVMAIEAGFCSTVLCAFACQNNPQGVIPTLFGSPWAIPYGDVGAITFMGHVARRQMHEHGITSRHYGHIAVTWRKHAATNPLAQKRAPITLEDHQRSRLINDPLRLLDCCLVTDGGGAEGGALVEAGELDVGGRLPANTAGGLLSEGHLSGFGHVAEAVRQVRGTSHCQVPDVEISMVTGYGGAPHEPPPTVAYTVAVLRP